MWMEVNTVIEDCLNTIKNDWLSTSDLFPDFLAEISYETKVQNEEYIQTVSEDFQKQIKSFSRISIGRKKWRQKTLTILMDVLYQESLIDIGRYMNQATIDALQEELKEFLRHVRKFAPDLSFEGIGQALRNYIVYVMFKEINQIKSGFNMACFGYSMLYPFTDNYIDNERYSIEEKLSYNQMIRDKIEDREVHPQTIHERKTCELFQAIESEYPRTKDSTVFTLLHMILEAQEDSIRQQNTGVIISAEERLNISLCKGGISVLIDRFFVKKEITNEDLSFYLGFGLILQLTDDLQDMKEDSEQFHQTIFTVDLNHEQVEKLVNKLIHFVCQTINSYQAQNDNLMKFILYHCYQLILSSVVDNKEFFSKEYINKLEKYFLVSYPFLEQLKKKQTENKDIKYQDTYLRILDEMI